MRLRRMSSPMTYVGVKRRSHVWQLTAYAVFKYAEGVADVTCECGRAEVRTCTFDCDVYAIHEVSPVKANRTVFYNRSVTV